MAQDNLLPSGGRCLAAGFIALILVVGVSLAALSFLFLTGREPPVDSLEGTPPPEGSATSSPLDGFKTYTHPDNSFRLAYPADWEQSTPEESLSERGVIFEGPQDQVVSVLFYNDPGTLTPVGFTTNYCSVVGELTAGPAPITIGRQQWTRAECDNSDGLRHSVVESVIYQNRLFSLVAISPKTTFGANQVQFFEKMEQSFTFL